MGLMDFRGAPTKPLSSYSDKELIAFIQKPGNVVEKAKAIKEAQARGLKNPKTGKPYQS